jgi:hypothetical protein
MTYLALFYNVFEALNWFWKKYAAEIQLPGNSILLLSIHNVLALFAIGDFPSYHLGTASYPHPSPSANLVKMPIRVVALAFDLCVL